MQTAWKGNLSFGLLTLPVRMHKATSAGGVSFRTLHAKDKGPIKEKRVCSVCGEEVPWKEVTKGYEIADGRYVTVEKEELAAVEPESSSNLEIREFVARASIDPSYFDRTYVLAPDKGGAKAYRLLQAVLDEAGKAAVGKVALRGREHLVLVRPGEGLLYAEFLHWPEEVRDLAEVREGIPETSPQPEEVEMAKLLVDRLTRDWDPEKYADEYTRRVHELLEKKAAGEPFELPSPAAPAAPTQDLLAALRASLERVEQEKASAGA